MRVPVLTAVSDAVWEAELVGALESADLGIEVVRRCVDLADLLATAATCQARAALLSADLRRLDRDALARLDDAGVAVVGVVPEGDEQAEHRLRQLGVTTVVPAESAPAQLCEAVLSAVSRVQGADASAGDAGPGVDAPTGEPPADPFAGAARGAVVAVWGPTGAPGRTTLAVGIAAELAALARSTLLLDADVYGGVVAQVLGLLDEAPGLAAACRLANAGTLDAPSLAQLARRLTPDLAVLTGIARADRWPELRPAALESVLDLARRLAAVTVVDCAFALEQDEELAYDTAAPRRNGATLTVLEQADTVIAVGTADPVGLQRLVRGLGELKEALPDVQPRVVVNRLRSTAVPGDAAAEVRSALARYAGVQDLALVPLDVAALDGALASGRTLVESAPASPARLAIRDLAGSLVGVRPPGGRHRARRRR